MYVSVCVCDGNRPRDGTFTFRNCLQIYNLKCPNKIYHNNTFVFGCFFCSDADSEVALPNATDRISI